MADGGEPAAARVDARKPGRERGEGALYGALDLGTNNCRLLIATPTAAGFRVVDSYSRIVRLGEGLTVSGRLGDAAMDRALAALTVCGDRLRKRGVTRVQAVATQACRTASNGPAFLQRVLAEAGVSLRVITPREEAHLAVAGCLNLLDRGDDAALVVDVGGGSTELSWVDLTDARLDGCPRTLALDRLPIRAWVSIPIGVVSLAEMFPETAGERAWFEAMIEHVKSRLAAYTDAEGFRDTFRRSPSASGRHLGAITSLAGLHLGPAPLRPLARRRPMADSRPTAPRPPNGCWRSPPRPRGRACIGPDRADLVLAGAAILQAVQDLWPCERVRVADRGLREGLLLSVMAESRSPRRGRRRRRGGSA
jgi:exopolyphosphatase/guanosine-5'-triphosphate,3'-diphosphate pyrophosphatase